MREEASVVDFSTKMIPVLRQAARSLRAEVPEDDVTIRGNVVRFTEKVTTMARATNLLPVSSWAT